MYYELLILGRLMYGPYHGYMIISVLGEMLGPWQKVSAGSLYPLLARLERNRMIVGADPEPSTPRSRRTAHTYVITSSGRARFRTLMLDTTSSVGDYQRLFHLKVPHLEFLTPDEQAQLLEHYRDYCRAAIRHREKNTRDLRGWLADMLEGRGVYNGTATQAGLEHSIETTVHMAEQWRGELAWIERLLERITERR